MTDIAGEVRRHDLQPGDILVLRVDGSLSAYDAALLRDRMRAEFPAHQCVILGNGVDLEVVRPEVVQ